MLPGLGKVVWATGSTTICNFLMAYKEKSDLKTLSKPSLPYSFEAVLRGIKQRASESFIAAATDAAGAVTPPVPPGAPATNPVAAKGPQAGGGHLLATTAAPTATPANAVTPPTSAATQAPVVAPGAPLHGLFMSVTKLVRATDIDLATGRPINASEVDQVAPAASPAAAAVAAGIHLRTMTHRLIRATVLNLYATPTQDEAMGTFFPP